MSRTTAELVKGVLLEDYDTAVAASLTPFIDTASIIVDDLVTCAARKGHVYSDAKLEMIERWLAAHGYVMSDQNYRSNSNLSASGAFQGETGKYFEGSKYGMMAIVLDTANCLEDAGRRPKVIAAWLGKRPSQQTDYRDRQ